MNASDYINTGLIETWNTEGKNRCNWSSKISKMKYAATHRKRPIKQWKDLTFQFVISNLQSALLWGRLKYVGLKDRFQQRRYILIYGSLKHSRLMKAINWLYFSPNGFFQIEKYFVKHAAFDTELFRGFFFRKCNFLNCNIILHGLSIKSNCAHLHIFSMHYCVEKSAIVYIYFL